MIGETNPEFQPDDQITTGEAAPLDSTTISLEQLAAFEASTRSNKEASAPGARTDNEQPEVHAELVLDLGLCDEHEAQATIPRRDPTVGRIGGAFVSGLQRYRQSLDLDKIKPSVALVARTLTPDWVEQEVLYPNPETDRVRNGILLSAEENVDYTGSPRKFVSNCVDRIDKGTIGRSQESRIESRQRNLPVIIQRRINRAESIWRKADDYKADLRTLLKEVNMPKKNLSHMSEYRMDALVQVAHMALHEMISTVDDNLPENDDKKGQLQDGLKIRLADTSPVGSFAYWREIIGVAVLYNNKKSILFQSNAAQLRGQVRRALEMK